MSCSNLNKKVEKKEVDKKTELSFFSSPIHEYLRLIAISFVALHFGTVITKHQEISTFLMNNTQFQIALLFAFFYLNSNYKLELSIVCTIVVLIVLYSLKYIKNKK